MQNRIYLLSSFNQSHSWCESRDSDVTDQHVPGVNLMTVTADGETNKKLVVLSIFLLFQILQHVCYLLCELVDLWPNSPGRPHDVRK